MTEALHVVFTLDGPGAGPGAAPRGPRGWEASARSIDAFCTTLLNSGFSATLFLTPEAAQQHAPMCEELVATGVEIGLLIEPPALRGAGLKRLLGAYDTAEQIAIAGEARRRFMEALGYRPLSARSAFYSANDGTFGALAATGFRQASVSSPGRLVARDHADWDDALPEPHLTSAASRLEVGDLEVLEVPVTTDPTQRRGGIAPELAIENGTVERWHAPLIDGQLARQEARRVTFRTLCFVSSTGVPYHDSASRPRQTLDALLDHLNSLEERYTLVPATLAALHAHYHAATQVTPTP